jgi:hypothetical protein
MSRHRSCDTAASRSPRLQRRSGMNPKPP